jgi:hypothetical protein
MKQKTYKVDDLVYVTDYQPPLDNALNGFAVIKKIFKGRAGRRSILYLLRLDGYRHNNIPFYNGHGFYLYSDALKHSYIKFKKFNNLKKCKNLKFYFKIFYNVDYDTKQGDYEDVPIETHEDCNCLTLVIKD